MTKFTTFFKQLKESLISITPIGLIVTVIFILQYTPLFISRFLSYIDYLVFLACLIFIGLGMCLFSIGSEQSMTKVGMHIGSAITRRKSIVMIVIIAFLLGLMITIAEPDLTVLADLVGNNGLMNSWIFKLCIGIGVGIFLVIGLCRIIFQKSLRLWIIFFYCIIFGLACLFGENGSAIFEISFDSSGVTTGPITVPFLLTFGAGVAAVRGGRNSSGDSFGVTGLCSIGPIIFSMIMFLPFQNSEIFKTVTNPIDLSPNFVDVLSRISLEVLIAISPLILFFLFFNFAFIKLTKTELLRILIGFVYTYAGLTLFLVAANIGLIPIGYSIGNGIMDLGMDYSYILIILSTVIGCAIVLVEPSVHVLVTQVEEISGRAISKKSILISLCIGVASAICLAVIRITYGNNFNIMYLYVPLFLLAIALTFTVPDIYVAIAFDAGGVASGTMASCFVLPFIIGIGASDNTVNGVTGFGVIGLISVMPIITIQFLGLSASIKSKFVMFRARKSLAMEGDDQIVNLG